MNKRVIGDNREKERKKKEKENKREGEEFSHVWYAGWLGPCKCLSIVFEGALIVDKSPGLFQAPNDPVRPVQAADWWRLNGRENGQIGVEVLESVSQSLQREGGREGGRESTIDLALFSFNCFNINYAHVRIYLHYSHKVEQDFHASSHLQTPVQNLGLGPVCGYV